MVKSPLNRELVATYEVTLSVIDNASDLPERSVSVPNGKAPPGHLLWVTQSRSGQGQQAGNGRQAMQRACEVAATVRLGVALCPSGQSSTVGVQKPRAMCDLEPKVSEWEGGLGRGRTGPRPQSHYQN